MEGGWGKDLTREWEMRWKDYWDEMEMGINDNGDRILDVGI